MKTLVYLCSPCSWDVFQAANWTVREATVDNFKIPFCTETLNTSTHTAEALSDI